MKAIATKMLSPLRFAPLLVVFLALESGCKKKAPPPPPPPPPPIKPVDRPPAKLVAKIDYFHAEPSNIQRGQSSTLRWAVYDADMVTIEPDIGTVPAQGSRQVYPGSSTSYTLSARAVGGNDSRTVTVTVTEPRELPPPDPNARRVVVEPRPEPSSESPGLKALPSPVDDAVAKLGSAGWVIVLPAALVDGEEKTVRLVIDPTASLPRTREEYEKEITLPNRLAGGQLTKFAQRMKAELTGGSSVKIKPEGPIEQIVVSTGPTEWFWNVLAHQVGEQNLDIELKMKVSVLGAEEWVNAPNFPQHRTVGTIRKRAPPMAPTLATLAVRAEEGAPNEDPPGVPPRSVPPSLSSLPSPRYGIYVLCSAIAILICRVVLKHFRKSRIPIPHSLDGPRRIRIAVIHERGADGQLIEYLERLAGPDRYQFCGEPSGYPRGSVPWQQATARLLESTDAVLLLEAPDQIKEAWMCWRIEQAFGLQAAQGVPILAARLSGSGPAANGEMADRGLLQYSLDTDAGVSAFLTSLKNLVPRSTQDIRCFISYSRADRDIMDRVRLRLTQNHIESWVDTESIPGGSEWERRISEAIETSTHVLCVISPKSLGSRYVKDEIAWAQKKDKIIIPLVAADVELPFGLHRIMAIDIRDESEGLANLLRALRDSKKP